MVAKSDAVGNQAIDFLHRPIGQIPLSHRVVIGHIAKVGHELDVVPHHVVADPFGLGVEKIGAAFSDHSLVFLSVTKQDQLPGLDCCEAGNG